MKITVCWRRLRKAKGTHRYPNQCFLVTGLGQHARHMGCLAGKRVPYTVHWLKCRVVALEDHRRNRPEHGVWGSCGRRDRPMSVTAVQITSNYKQAHQLCTSLTVRLAPQRQPRQTPCVPQQALLHGAESPSAPPDSPASRLQSQRQRRRSSLPRRHASFAQTAPRGGSWPTTDPAALETAAPTH